MITVVSPHLDDAVLACGSLLSARTGAAVITALAGGPPRWEHLTPWDAQCGFSAGEDVIAARRAEDREALSILGAEPIWLDFCDAQYGRAPVLAELTAALSRALSACGPGDLFIPLGLFHSDHHLVADIALKLALTMPHRALYAYEEPIYRRLPGLIDDAVRRVAAHGISVLPAGPAVGESSMDRKRQAVSCYRSQLRGLSAAGRSGHDDAFAPERCWSLTA